jgi:drug/metabolite transporter (DMT)-like permease
VTPIALALVAAAGYGVSDFVGGVVSRRIAALRLVLVSYPLAMLIYLLLAPLVGGRIAAGSLLLGGLSGVCTGLALWWFYLAMAEGPMSVVSPLTAIIVAGLPVLVGLAAGEELTALAAVGVVVAIVAVVLVSKEAPNPKAGVRFTARVAWLTAGSGTTFALAFVLLHHVEAGTGLWPLVAARVAASAVALGAALFAGGGMAPDRAVLGWAVVLSFIDVIATTALLFALQSGLLSLVSVLAALYPAVTVLMAIVLLNERVSPTQWGGLVLALGAVAMIAGA